jgi:hypothetical protein
VRRDPWNNQARIAPEEEVVEGSTLTLIVRCVGDRERQKRFYKYLLTQLGLASSN